MRAFLLPRPSQRGQPTARAAADRILRVTLTYDDFPRTLVRIAALCLLLVTSATPARGQYPGGLAGRIVDTITGEPVENVLVEVLGTGLSALSDGRGDFEFRGLEPGRYSVRLTRLGYATLVRPVDIRNGQRAWLDAHLAARPLPVTEIQAEAGRAGAPGTIAISRAEIERSGARTAAEALEGRAGLVVATRGPTGPQTLSIRGSAADQVLVLLDGAPLGSPVTGTADLSSIPASQIESITVLKGSQSARFGPGAEAGAVLIESRTQSPPLGLYAGAGSLGAWSGGAEASGGGAPALSWALGLRARQIDGQFQYRQPAALGGSEATRLNNDLSQASGFLAATGRLAGGQTRLRITHTRLDRGLPGRSFAPTPQAREELTRWNGQVGWERTWSRSRVGTQVYGLTQTTRFFDSEPPPPLGPPYNSVTDALTVGGRLTTQVAFGGLLKSLSGGVELRRQRYESTAFDPAAPDGRFDLGSFVGGELSGAGGSARNPRLIAALRLDRDGLDHLWRLTHELTASASAGPSAFYIRHASSYSPPSFGDQFFMEGVAVQPNPALRAERVPNDLSAGVSLEGRLGNALTGRLALDAYDADVKGMIIWAPDFRFVWSPRNFDVKRRGLDAEGEVTLAAELLQLRAGYSYTRVTYDRGDGDDDVQVIYRPRHSGSFAAWWRSASWELGTEVRYTGTRYPFPAPVNALAPFWTVDVRLRRSFAVGAWTLTPLLAVDRVLDNQDALIFGYPDPGRIVRLEVDARPR